MAMENHISDLGPINRRKFERFDFSQDLLVEGEKFQIVPDVYSKNLSQKGACITTQKPMQIGSIITAEIPSSKLHLIAEVRWVRPESENQYKMGIIFHELFPQTKQQILDLIHQLRIEPEVETDQASSLELERGISGYLDQYIEQIKPDPIETYPAIHRRFHSTEENSFSVYTPSKSRWLELTSTSFRLEEKTVNVKPKSYVRAIVVIALLAVAIGIYFFAVQKTMKEVYSETSQTPSTTLSTFRQIKD